MKKTDSISNLMKMYSGGGGGGNTDHSDSDFVKLVQEKNLQADCKYI